MTSVESRYLRADHREDQLLNSVRKTLEKRKYTWSDPMMLKQGSGVTTNSLKELLINSSVEMEATTDTNVTALCTVDTEPVDSVESFERLCLFCEDCSSAQKPELIQILYPVFVHVYLDLIAGGHSGLAESFLDKFSVVIGSAHQSELQELSEVVSAEQVAVSPLASKFRNQKFFLRLSSEAFQLLMQFLQVCETPGLLSLMQRYLAIDVYGNALVSATEGSAKPEVKKGGHPLFVKPKIPQLEIGPVIKGKPQVRRELQMFQSSSEMVSSSFGQLASNSHTSADNVTSTFTIASSQENDSSVSRTELRERLAVCSQQLSPAPPSLALTTVHTSSNNSAHCAHLSQSSHLYACGFADSTVHLWSQIPPGKTSMKDNCPVGPQQDHHVLYGHHGPVYGVTFDLSGQCLLSCSEDCSVRLWDLPTKRSVASYRGHGYPVWDVTFSPVNVYFATASLDTTARLWTTDQVFPLRVFAGHTASVDVTRFHCNGNYLATGSRDSTCRLWDIQSGNCVRLMANGKSPITSLAFSPNGKQLVSGDQSGVIKIWDLGSGSMVSEHCQAPPTLKNCPVLSLAFSVDSTLLASSCHDNLIRVWSIKTLEQPNQTLTLKEPISQYKCEVGKMLQLSFTHRNCLFAVGTVGTVQTEEYNS